MTDIIDKEPYINKFLAAIGLNVAVGVEQQSKDDQETEIVLEKTYNFIDSNSAPRTEAISCNAKENLIPADFDIDDEVEAPKAVAEHDDDSDRTEQSTALPLSENENRSDEGISPDHLYFIVRTCGKG